MILRLVCLLALCLLLSSCVLKTRQQIETQKIKAEMSSNLAQLQKNNANQFEKNQTLEDQMRLLSGRIEAVEQRQQQQVQMNQNQLEENSKNLNDLSRQVTIIKSELNKIVEKNISLMNAIRQSNKPKVGNFKGAEQAFSKKNWRAAALGYEKYLELNPRGKFRGKALYRIAFSFEKMGNRQIAKSYYNNALSESPSSAYGRKAKSALTRLKTP